MSKSRTMSTLVIAALSAVRAAASSAGTPSIVTVKSGSRTTCAGVRLQACSLAGNDRRPSTRPRLALSNGGGAASGAERICSRRTIRLAHGHGKSREPNQGGSEEGREFSLCGSLPLPPRPELHRHRSGRQFSPLPFAPGNPRFPGAATLWGASLPHCSTIWSITLTGS